MKVVEVVKVVEVGNAAAVLENLREGEKEESPCEPPLPPPPPPPPPPDLSSTKAAGGQDAGPGSVVLCGAASSFCAWVSVPSRPSRHVLWRQLAELLRFQSCSVAVFVINPLFPGDYVVLLGLTVLLRPLQLKFPACQTLWGLQCCE
ncbi:putative histone-lysine N-methyltransferase PRDM6 [Scylla paramamosain]|uniref:putative histone-lysine N-methyltransferase PRDM6 n=1 Tax=Scylla paramamosain TaxID=85552 RepID=UPI003082D871